jgi:hypothetical protein
MLQKLALKLYNDTLSTTSNNKVSINSAQVELKDDEIIHQLKELMDMRNRISSLSDVSWEEENSHHVFR